jgi:hypothetical protein
MDKVIPARIQVRNAFAMSVMIGCCYGVALACVIPSVSDIKQLWWVRALRRS